jgi:hypothetical protein
VAELGSWGKTNQNDIHDEIRGRLQSANACKHSVHNLLLSFYILSKIAEIKIFKIKTSPFIFYGCGT